MNFFTALFSDSARASLFLKIGLLLPMLIPYVKAFEDVSSDLDGAEKKRSVLRAVNLTTDLLEKRGYITKAYNEGLDKIASELIDVIVEVFNTTGVFEHSEPSEKERIELSRRAIEETNKGFRAGDFRIGPGSYRAADGSLIETKGENV